MSTQLENPVIQNLVEEKKNREEYGGRDGDEEGRKGGNGEEGEKFLCGTNLRDNILIISGTIFFIDTSKKRGGGFHDICSDTMNGGWFVYSGSRSIITSSPCLLCCYRTIPGNHRD